MFSENWWVNRKTDIRLLVVNCIAIQTHRFRRLRVGPLRSAHGRPTINDKLSVKIDAIVGVLTTKFSSSTSSISSTSTRSILSTLTSPGSANSATTTLSNSPVTQTDHPSLNRGAKARIGIGAGLVAVLIVAAIVVFFWKRRINAAVGGPVYGRPTELPGVSGENFVSGDGIA
jgi:hypothetical protein